MSARVGVLYRYAAKLASYVLALQHVGLETVPLLPRQATSPAGLDGIVLTGGTDVDPALYFQPIHPMTQPPDRERDESEMDLLRQALDADLPVLAICRGMQLLNVFLGGRLIQHLPDSGIAHASPPPAGVEPGRHSPVHCIELEQQCLLTPCIGGRVHSVNSRHHQAVDRAGAGIVVTARAEDGVIESCEMPEKRFVLGVQWHPEDMVLSSRADLAVLEAFAAAVQKA